MELPAKLWFQETFFKKLVKHFAIYSFIIIMLILSIIYYWKNMHFNYTKLLIFSFNFTKINQTCYTKLKAFWATSRSRYYVLFSSWTTAGVLIWSPESKIPELNTRKLTGFLQKFPQNYIFLCIVSNRWHRHLTRASCYYILTERKNLETWHRMPSCENTST